MFAAILAFLKGLPALIGLGNKIADVVKTNQENARRDQDVKQGEQNANAKTTADGFKALGDAARAAHDPAVVELVRNEFERP